MSSLFGRIAPYYGLFFNYQKRYFGRVLNMVLREMDLDQYNTVLDVGCGTGALGAALNERGFTVTGIDPEQRMIDIARRKTRGAPISFLRADVLAGLPFPSKSFDVAIASYVAHGLKAGERQLMYREMSRVARHLVIVHDFNQNRSRIVDFIETLEGGDYFNFIEVVEREMATQFQQVTLRQVAPRATWYVGRPYD